MDTRIVAKQSRTPIVRSPFCFSLCKIRLTDHCLKHDETRSNTRSKIITIFEWLTPIHYSNQHFAFDYRNYFLQLNCQFGQFHESWCEIFKHFNNWHSKRNLNILLHRSLRNEMKWNANTVNLIRFPLNLWIEDIEAMYWPKVLCMS